MNLFLYSLLWRLLKPLVLLRLKLRSKSEAGYARNIGERFGKDYPTFDNTGKTIWLHAVSVGEMRAAQPLVRALRQHYPSHKIVLTCMTASGRETAHTLFADDCTICYLPYEYKNAILSFLQHFKPTLCLLMETEIWPLLIDQCWHQNLPVVLVNARLSEKSLEKSLKFKSLMRGSYSKLSMVLAQSVRDAKNLGVMNAGKIEICGNLKFDNLPAPTQIALGTQLKKQINPQTKNRPVLLLASTREGEEALILPYLPALFQAVPNLLLMVAPRHPQRFGEVANLFADYAVQLRSNLNVDGVTPIVPDCQVLLCDSMGEMFAWYQACDVAFIGGSLVEQGGQNLIEACAVGAPVLIGPSSFNFAEVTERALEKGAAIRVQNAQAMVQQAILLLQPEAGNRRRDMAEAGEKFALIHQGATLKTLRALSRFL